MSNLFGFIALRIFVHKLRFNFAIIYGCIITNSFYTRECKETKRLHINQEPLTIFGAKYQKTKRIKHMAAKGKSQLDKHSVTLTVDILDIHYLS